MGIKQRYTPVFDDMKGQIRSAITGGTVWDEEVITGTSFVVGALKNNSGDMFQLLIQVPHTCKLSARLEDIHVHYVLQAASTAGDTIVWNTSYAWVTPGDAIPASFTALPSKTQILGTHPVRYYHITDLAELVDVQAITPPANESYGSMLLFTITRGNGTYTGKVGILDSDSHREMDRNGSELRFSDSV